MIRILIGSEQELDSCHVDTYANAEIVIQTFPNGEAKIVVNRLRTMTIGVSFSSATEALAQVLP